MYQNNTFMISNYLEKKDYAINIMNSFINNEMYRNELDNVALL